MGRVDACGCSLACVLWTCRCDSTRLSPTMASRCRRNAFLPLSAFATVTRAHTRQDRHARVEHSRSGKSRAHSWALGVQDATPSVGSAEWGKYATQIERLAEAWCIKLENLLSTASRFRLETDTIMLAAEVEHWKFLQVKLPKKRTEKHTQAHTHVRAQREIEAGGQVRTHVRASARARNSSEA